MTAELPLDRSGDDDGTSMFIAVLTGWERGGRGGKEGGKTDIEIDTK